MTMIDFFYCIRQKLLRYYDGDILDNYLNMFIQYYYKVTRSGRNGIRNRGRRHKIIISLTTIPDRIDNVWLTIESLLRQIYKPDKIILWLAREEFNGRELPKQLKQQMKRGLTIKYCDNLKSYKKFYYTVKENPQAYVVTVDDDFIYSEKMLETLVREYKKNPGCIICNRSHLIKMRNSRLLCYNSWEKYETRTHICNEPSYQNFFTSGAGTFIPMFYMDKRLMNKEAFMEFAPNADDVWLNFIAWISGLKTKNTEGVLGHLIHIPSSDKNSLYRQNVLKNQNDIQIQEVLKYLDINIQDYL